MDAEGELLSNFAHTPFLLDGKEFASVEAFVQYIKYPEGAEHKEEIPQLVGEYVKRRGRIANRLIEARYCLQGNGFEGIYVYWKGERIPYRSDNHMKLIERAIEAKFQSNPEAHAALLASSDKRIIHNLGYPESACTSFPAEDFCRILMDLCAEYASHGAEH